MIGGGGDDTYVVDNAGDQVSESGGSGTDLVQTSVNFTLGAGVENLTGTGMGNIVLAGNDLANIINGNAGNNTLDGGVDTVLDTLTGGQGNDTYIIRDNDDVIVEAGADTLNGTANGNDTVLVVASANRATYTLGAGVSVENLVASDATGTTALNLTGNALAQVIAGNAGVNVLTGGGGADTLIGFGGNDTYNVSTTGTSVVEQAGGGTDTVNIVAGSAAGTYNIGDNVEVVNVQATTAVNVTTGAGAQTINGNGEANRINGGAGNDTMNGGAGNDTYLVDALGDVITDTAGTFDMVIASSSYQLEGSATGIEYLVAAGTNLAAAAGGTGDGTLNLNALNTTATSNYFVGDTATSQTIFGDAGANILNGRTGAGTGGTADLLIGGNGSDTYRVYDQTDVVAEDTDGGAFDTIFASADFSLAQNDINAGLASFTDEAGNARGISGFINGAMQIERLSTADQAGTTDIDLTGNAYGQIIQGNFGNNVISDGGSLLNGVQYQDQLAGLRGNDTYNVTAQNTTVNENVGEGTDVVNVNLDGGTSNFFGLIAAAEVEYLLATGTNAINLQGNGFAQVIRGNAAANTFDGAGGADTLIGGDGSDSYLITAFNANTARIIEGAGAVGDSDRVVTSVSFDLAATNAAYTDENANAVAAGGIIGIEQIIAADGQGTDAINLTGNGAAQILVGNFGNNILNGDNDTVDGNGVAIGTAAGDTLTGLFGDDIYRVYSQNDVVREVAGQGNDTVFTSGNYQLREGGSIETFSAADQQSTTGLQMIGNSLAQTIIGTDGADTIWGGAGNDTLTGRGGSDIFGFGEVGAANADFISDFAAGDFIGLSTTAFAGLGTDVDFNEFVNGTTAVGTNAQILYNQATGEIFYDADGTGSGAAVLFASVAAGTQLGFNDFDIIGATPATIPAA
nr:calcium-binding protein [Sphingomonas sp. AX6]